MNTERPSNCVCSATTHAVVKAVLNAYTALLVYGTSRIRTCALTRQGGHTSIHVTSLGPVSVPSTRDACFSKFFKLKLLWILKRAPAELDLSLTQLKFMHFFLHSDPSLLLNTAPVPTAKSGKRQARRRPKNNTSTVINKCGPPSLSRYRKFATGWTVRGSSPVKADSHKACRAHAVPLPCRAAKGLECVFPIWFTQCGRVWFTLHICVTPTRPHCVNQMGKTHSCYVWIRL
jgi:hypothetical protein